MYFIYNNTIKRLDLNKKDAKYEDYLNLDSYIMIHSFHFLSDGTMLLHEDKSLRIVNLDTKEINKINLKSKIGEFPNVGKGIINLGDIPIKENPKTKEIFLFLENRTNSVYKINEDNEITLQKQLNKAVDLSGFDFDNDGNLYTVSSRLEKLIKVSLSGEIKELSNLIGLIDFNPKQDGFVQLTNLFFISISLDRKRNILYITPGQDRIFKINLNKEIK